MIQHIVQINDLSDPKGGASKLAVQAACDLANLGHKVTFITGDTGESPALTKAGVEIIALGQGRLLASSLSKAMITGIWNHAAFKMVREWIASNDTPHTAYHLHGWSQILSPAIFSALDPVRNRLVISAHDFFLACPNGAFAKLKTGEICPHTPLSLKCLATPCDRDGAIRKTWRSARQIVQKQVYKPKSSPPVLAIHSAMQDYLSRADIPADSIITLPNPIEPFSESRVEAEHNRNILFVGRLEATKGADLAAAAAAQANAPITFVGEGPLAQQISEICPHANLVGRRTPSEIRQFATQARALVMPSRYPEPFGLVAIEACWSGIPTIVSKTALLSSDLVNAGAGVAIDPRNISAFSNTLQTMSNDDQLILKMSQAAYSNTRNLALTPNVWTQNLYTIMENRVRSSSQTPN